MSVAVAALVLGPPLAAAVSFLGGRRTVPFLLPGTAAACLAALAALGTALWEAGGIRHAVGGWEAPLGIGLAVDGLSLLMLAAAWPVAVAVGYQAWRRRVESLFWPVFFFFWGTLHALFLSADIFNLYVALELLTLSSVALVARARTKEAVAAALRYLLAAMLGSASYLLGVGLLYGVAGSLSLPDLAGLPGLGAGGRWATSLILVGLLLKAAAFPLHFWLPPAYLHAAPPGDALLAAVGTKAALYLLLRLWPALTGTTATGALPFALGLLGSGAVVWGALMALRAERLKLLLAFSSISQMGYVLLLFSLRDPGSPQGRWALEGATMLLLSHTLAAAAMFLAAEGLVAQAGSDRVLDLRRGRGRPLLAVYAFGLGGVSLIGLPPSGGFVAKWYLLKSCVESGQWWWIPALAVGGLLAAGYVFRVIMEAVAEDPALPEPPDGVAEGPHLTGFLLAALAILLGLAGVWPLEILRRGGAP